MGWEWGPVHGRRETPYVWTERQTYTSENITLEDSKNMMQELNNTAYLQIGYFQFGSCHGHILVLLSVDDAIGDISGDIIKSGAVEQRLRDGDTNLSLFPIGLDENCSCKKQTPRYKKLEMIG